MNDLTFAQPPWKMIFFALAIALRVKVSLWPCCESGRIQGSIRHWHGF